MNENNSSLPIRWVEVVGDIVIPPVVLGIGFVAAACVAGLAATTVFLLTPMITFATFIVTAVHFHDQMKRRFSAGALLSMNVAYVIVEMLLCAVVTGLFLVAVGVPL